MVDAPELPSVDIDSTKISVSPALILAGEVGAVELVPLPVAPAAVLPNACAIGYVMPMATAPTAKVTVPAEVPVVTVGDSGNPSS